MKNNKTNNKANSATYLFDAKRNGKIIRTLEGLTWKQLDTEVKQAIADNDLYTWWAS